MPISWWLAFVAAALILAFPQDAYLFTEWLVLRWKLYWLNRRMERLARKIYKRLQQDHREMGWEPLPPFSWKALEHRYGQK